jgi:hypothetical protein
MFELAIVHLASKRLQGIVGLIVLAVCLGLSTTGSPYWLVPAWIGGYALADAWLCVSAARKLWEGIEP